MGHLVSSSSTLLLILLPTLLSGSSSVFSQDLRERDALCNADGCFVVYFQRKTFLDSWRSCKEKGGNLATVKQTDHATTIANLFSTLDLRHSRTKVQVWIGLQRQPRQCSTTSPLRGFSWTTGDQDTEFTNWQREESPMCMVPRCVVIGYSTQDQNDNFKWLDGSCSVSADGYLCHYDYKGMCGALQSEGAGNALYNTPFNLVSTLLTHVPFGSVGTVPCPAKEKQLVVCTLKDDGSMGWSRDFPLCSDSPVLYDRCDHNNGGCEHFCWAAGVHFYCVCADGYKLGDNGKRCELSDVCEGALCEFECLPLSDGYRCACPEGYMLSPDERGCLDVDECLQSPCEHICVNGPGTFECECREGYHVDDQGECEDIDECINDPCEHACENTPGSLICHCHLGYSPMPEDSTRCQETDECQIPGTCEQMCVNYEGAFDCYCKEGYELMSDNYSCNKRGEGDGQSAITPPFPWVTNQPGLVWDSVDYDWNPQQSHTEWPPEEEQTLDWLTDPPSAFNSDIIWVTSALQEHLPFDLGLDLPTREPERDKGGERNNGETDPLESGKIAQTDLEVLPMNINTTPLSSTKSSTSSDGFKDEREETTTALPFLSTRPIAEGAWNWWMATSSHKPGNPADSTPDHNMPTDSNNSNEAEGQYSQRENSKFLNEEDRDEKKYSVEMTHSQEPTVPTQRLPSLPALTGGGGSDDILDSVQEDIGQNQSITWLLVGLLVPICIFTVVMLVLGIIYCSRCAPAPENKNATDCYHWMSGAHDKRGASNPSPGVKSCV